MRWKGIGGVGGADWEGIGWQDVMGVGIGVGWWAGGQGWGECVNGGEVWGCWGEDWEWMGLWIECIWEKFGGDGKSIEGNGWKGEVYGEDGE